VGDGPGQGPRGTRGREAAMGVTIFFGLARKKWWGPVVLDAAPKPTSRSDFCERDLSNLSA